MKKIMIVALLLGVMTMEGKPEYRIKMWTRDGITYYQPEKRMNRLKGWESYRHPFQYWSLAETIIVKWKEEYSLKHNPKEYQYETL